MASNILQTPALWTNAYAASPPTEFVNGALEVDAAAYTFALTATPVDPYPANTMVAGFGTIQHDHSTPLYLNVMRGSAVAYSIAIAPGGPVSVSFAGNVGGGTTAVLALSAAAGSATPFSVPNLVLDITPSVGVDINCTCSDDEGLQYRTLKELRDAVMRRLGWGNQLLNPPPGSVDMINSFLYEAQVSLYNRFTPLRGIRYFTWQLAQGVALYGLGENIDDCDKRLNPNKLEWVGVVREGNLWTTLIAGIPELLNSYPDSSGYPVRYALRQCLQVWPIPDGNAGQLVIKGEFGLLPFAGDDDVATVNDSLVFSLALADAKAHYRQPDADRYIARVEALLNSLVAGTHTTQRYIPGRNQRNQLIYVEPMPSVPFPT